MHARHQLQEHALETIKVQERREDIATTRPCRNRLTRKTIPRMGPYPNFFNSRDIPKFRQDVLPMIILIQHAYLRFSTLFARHCVNEVCSRYAPGTAGIMRVRLGESSTGMNGEVAPSQEATFLLSI